MASVLLRRRLPSPTTAEVANGLWIAAGLLYLAIVTVSMTRISYDVWGGLVIAPLLTFLSLPLMRRILRRQDPSMVNLITIAFLVKLAGIIGRYIITFGLYGYGDSEEYHLAGGRLAQALWGGTFSEQLQADVPELIGTHFIKLTTGLLYAVTGPTLLGAFVVYGVLSFWGQFFFFRALRTAFPDADYRRYAYLLFFLPSLLYWPSSLGKDAWMLCTIGLATYGVALILAHNVLGYAYAGFGIAGTAMVRPHITALLVMSLIVAYMLRRRSWRESRTGPFGKWIGVVVLLGVGGVMLGRVAAFFDVDSLDSSSVDSVLETTNRNTSQGGSQFESVTPTSPADFPMAIITVLFRPFPWEATGGGSGATSEGDGAGAAGRLSTAFEGSVLLLITIVSWRRLARVPGFLFRVPFLAFCVAYSAMFIFAFSSINNFGLLSRQRTQVFPIVLVLLAVPPPRIDDGDDMVDDGRRIRVGALAGYDARGGL